MDELIVNTEHTVTIDGYTSGGLGVCRVGGRAVFVAGALRGEICRIRILKASRAAAHAELIDVAAPSPDRINPACVNFGKCGGCDFLHMTYAEELELKRTRVQDALRRIGGFDIVVPTVVGSNTQQAYRNKAVYVIGEAGGRSVAGFYGKRSHDIVPAGKCLIQSDISLRAAAAVTGWMEKFGIAPYDERRRTGSVRRVFCRIAAATGATQGAAQGLTTVAAVGATTGVTSGVAQIALITADRKPAYLDRLVERLLESCPETASIVLNANNRHSTAEFTGKLQTLWGGDSITDELCGLSFRLSPRAFYQVNHKQAERLYAQAVNLAALTKEDTALDLYCGAGTITLLLARSAGRAIGAEITPDAVRDARENAKTNGITNAEFINADANAAAQALKSGGVAPAAIVVDPPRRGLTPDIIGTIAAMSPKRLVYISCDPATLARDLKAFSELGYPLTSVTPFDMFPRCAHIECCCLLERGL